MLNSEKSKKTLKWKPKYDIIETIKLISDWYNIFFKKKKKYFINNSKTNY